MWNGFHSKEFMFSERNAVIVFPNEKANGKMLLKTEYLDAFPEFDKEMLSRGYHLIHIAHFSRWAPDDEINIMADFVKHCAKELRLSEQCMIEGLSCGGLQAVRFAETYPELCTALYLDAPVLNILSMAGLGELKKENADQFWREIASTFHVSKSTIVNFRKSAIDNMSPLIANNIPIMLLYGNADDVVIYEENGKVLVDYYQQHHGNIKVIVRSMGGHHPHGLKNPALIADFLENAVK